MLLDDQAELDEKRGGTCRMRCAVARRVVGRHFYQLGQEALHPRPLLDQILVNSRLGRIGHGGSPVVSGKCSTKSSSTRAAASMSSVAAYSSGWWLKPRRQRTNSMAKGRTPRNAIASWPAPLANRQAGWPQR